MIVALAAALLVGIFIGTGVGLALSRVEAVEVLPPQPPSDFLTP